jgi:hypothetical protein
MAFVDAICGSSNIASFVTFQSDWAPERGMSIVVKQPFAEGLSRDILVPRALVGHEAVMVKAAPDMTPLDDVAAHIWPSGSHVTVPISMPRSRAVTAEMSPSPSQPPFGAPR